MKNIILALGVICLAGCAKTIMNTNPYYQTNYDSECLYTGITWSELALCQQKDLESEWAQNNITNDLLSKKTTNDKK